MKADTGSNTSRRSLLLGAASVGSVTALPAGARARKHSKTEPPAFDAVLADLHRRTFDYFWETTPDNGLAGDNWPNPDFCSVASVGFALTAFCIGAKSGYVSRAAAAERTVKTLRTLWNGPQGPEPTGNMGYKGFFYHFLHADTGLRYERVELSSIDTTLCLGGVLTGVAYFDGADGIEAEIRKLGMAIYERVDWTFMERDNGLISMGWHPERGLDNHDANGLIERSWDRYNEGMMVYHLGMASPTHPIKPTAWGAWAATLAGTWGPNYAKPHLAFSPHFGHQYSHVWFDYRGIADDFMRARNSDYFINSQRATQSQRAYAISNPAGFTGYGADIWGLTACRGPGYLKGMVNGREVQFQEYGARGPSGLDNESFDDGTIAPTAAAASVAFSPDIAVPAIKAMRSRYGNEIYGKYGFFDAFNPSFPRALTSRTGNVMPKAGWVAKEYLGIDQGPILAMLENYRSGLIWDLFNRSKLTGPIVRRGFKLAGFQPVAPSGKWLNA